MKDKFSYHDYVGDDVFLAQYNDYQARYAQNIRESDKVIIELVRKRVNQEKGRRLKILDIGCSTGNLLLHLKRMIPDADYFGGDLAQSSIKECRTNSDLQGVEFYEMDILNFKLDYPFDIIIANAVAVYFTWQEYKEAINNVFRNLTSGGSYIIFEWMHPFIHQDIQIFETSVMHPEGIRICFRPVSKVRDLFVNIGFSDCTFFPFELPLDIQMPGYDEEVVTYTVPRQDGSRMMFRGALYQPWCHMVANK